MSLGIFFALCAHKSPRVVRDATSQFHGSRPKGYSSQSYNPPPTTLKDNVLNTPRTTRSSPVVSSTCRAVKVRYCHWVRRRRLAVQESIDHSGRFVHSKHVFSTAYTCILWYTCTHGQTRASVLDKLYVYVDICTRDVPLIGSTHIRVNFCYGD